MENENICNDEKRNTMSSNDMSNDISVSLASLLKSFSHNSGGISDIPVTSELNVDLEQLERNLLLSKPEHDEYTGCKTESFLKQLSNGDRCQTIEFINDKRSKSQFDNDIAKSLRDDNKSLTRFTNSCLSSNTDAINSIQMHSMSALKSLLSNQNGQIYLLVKGDTVQALDGSSNLTGLFDAGNFSQNVQLSADVGEDISSDNNCSTTNNPSLMMAAQQFQMSNNLSTAELIQKILETPQTSSCSNNNINNSNTLESIIDDHKIPDPSLPRLLSDYPKQSIQSNNVTNYYTCSVDSNNEPDVTLLVDEDNSESNSQFHNTNNNRTTKNDKQIFLLNGNIKVESRQTSAVDTVDNSVKNHYNSLLNDRNESLEIITESYNDISNNFVQSNLMSSFIATATNDIMAGKHHKRIKTKPFKNIEINAYTEPGSKTYSPNSPIFSMSVSQLEDNSSKESVNGNGEIKELKRKSSHNEVERRRRDRINTWIGELQNMLPNSERAQLNKSKSHVLKAVYDYFRGQTDRFNDIKKKNDKLEEESREKSAIIKKLESEKEVLLNQLQYINQAVTSTVKSTQESLNRSTVNQYRINPMEKIKITQPYRITNVYTNSGLTNFATGFAIIDNNQQQQQLQQQPQQPQTKKRKLTDDENKNDEKESVL